MSVGKASLEECQTIYSLEDVYLLLEILAVEAHNRAKIQNHFKNNPRL